MTQDKSFFDLIIFPDRLHEKLTDDETRRLEFKEIKGGNPDDSIPKEAERYAVGFLNSEGGVIIWGVRDADKSVEGIALSEAQRDRIRRDVVEKLGRVQPKVDDRRFRLEIRQLEGVPESEPTRFIVTLEVPHIPATEPYYTGSGECFIRLDGVLKQKKGPELTHHILSRRPTPTAVASIEDPGMAAMVKRLRQILEVHGLKHGHMARFLETRQAPFAITLNDLSSDGMFLNWLDEAKINWISRTFLIRREWIDGEDTQVHESFCFDKQPRRLWELLEKLNSNETTREAPALAEAFFIRRGKPKKWPSGDESRVLVVLRVPLARLSNELTIYKYISDFTSYPWEEDHADRCAIQLRAWCRMLHLHHGFKLWGCTVQDKEWSKIEENDAFLPQTIIAADKGRWSWEPEDYAYLETESRAAKDTDTLLPVLEFLEYHGLPTH